MVGPVAGAVPGADPSGCGVPQGAGGDGSGPSNFAAFAKEGEYQLPPRNPSGKGMKCVKGYCEYRLKYDPLASANFSDKILQGLLFLSK